MELTKSPKVLPLPAIEAGGVRRNICGSISARIVTITRALDTFGASVTAVFMYLDHNYET
jgi:hypothetical protein